MLHNMRMSWSRDGRRRDGSPDHSRRRVGFENDVPFVEDDPPRRVIPRRVKAPLGDVRRPESPWVDMAEKNGTSGWRGTARGRGRRRRPPGIRGSLILLLMTRPGSPVGLPVGAGVALSALGAVVVRQRAFDVAEEPAGRRVDGAGRRRALGWGAGVGVDGVQDAVEAFRPFSPSSGFKALQAFVTAAAACSTSSLAAFTAAVIVASSLAAMA